MTIDPKDWKFHNFLKGKTDSGDRFVFKHRTTGEERMFTINTLPPGFEVPNVYKSGKER